ncbi:synaptic vesicle 2-related protein-like [Saccoglossus kowalevskii]|uniref:Synaptic vesicle 2-related protein-like n=1 Tax=Saccoglossus kowalevskii TaxID=10224 RepID=A0ABM0MD32_SACKO|nr:PREDICTED: synaptic vesicle 2-related protein-like [Saccoglossus kowalevskii]
MRSVKRMYQRLLDGSSNDEEELDILHPSTNQTIQRKRPDGSGQQTYTVEEAVEHMGFGKFQISLTFLLGTFTFSDACEMMLLAVLSPVVRCEWQLSPYQVASITTVVFAGMLIGSSVWGTSTDRYGRKVILFLVAVWISYYGYLTAFSPNYYWLILLRFLVGFGIGGAPQGFTALSEFLPSKQRAKLLGSTQVFWALGTCFEVFMAFLVIPTIGWRYLVGFSAIPLTISLLAFRYLPESVRYCMAAGQQDVAVETLKRIAKENNTTLPPGELVKSVELPRGKFVDLFTKEYARTTLHLWFLWFAAAFSYYGLVLVSSEVLEFDSVCGAMEEWSKNSKEDGICFCQLLSKSDYVTIILTTLGELVAIPMNVLLVDAIGRIKLLVLYFFLFAMFICFLLICSNRIFLTFTVFGIRAFSSGIFNIVYIYTVEVYPTTVRAVGLGTGSSMARVGAMITPFVAQVLLVYSVNYAVFVYAGVSVIGLLLAATLPIETRGRPIKEH